MKKSVFSVINFCYWMYNFPGPFDSIIMEVFNDRHFVDKWENISKGATFVNPGHIVAFITELSDNNQRKFIEYIENTYIYRKIEIFD